MQGPENTNEFGVKGAAASSPSAKGSPKRKRVYHLLPEVRRQVPAMFDRMSEDKVAEQFGIPVRDVVAEAVRDLRRMLRKPPASDVRIAVVRKGAAA